MILDGRNRYRARQIAGIEPRFRDYDGDDPLAFVLSLNLHRRHLDESQRAMVAARLANLKDGQRAASIEASASQGRVAKLLNVRRSGVQRAQVIDKGAPELIQAVDRGDIAVSVAAALATASEAVQRRAVAEPERAHVLVKQERRAQRERELGARQLAWPTKIHGVIYADPPWPWTSYSQITGMDRTPSYPTMDLEAIKALDVRVHRRARLRAVHVGDRADAPAGWRGHGRVGVRLQNAHRLAQEGSRRHGWPAPLPRA